MTTKATHDLDVVPRGLKGKLGSGPYGLGLPDDPKLSRVDITTGLPVAIREIIERENCQSEHDAYLTCRDQNYWTKFISCRNDKQLRINCIKNHWYDEGLHDRAKQEYIEERSIYRATGLTRRCRENSGFAMKSHDRFIKIRKDEDMPKENKSLREALKIAFEGKTDDK